MMSNLNDEVHDSNYQIQKLVNKSVSENGNKSLSNGETMEIEIDPKELLPNIDRCKIVEQNKIVRKRGRPRKTPQPESEEPSCSNTSTPIKSKRNLLSINYAILADEPTEKLERKRKKIVNHDENEADCCTFQSEYIGENSKKIKISTVICGVCHKEVEKSGWVYHKQRFHNNLTWRVGEEPLDLENEKLVNTILGNLYKQHKPLYCEKCGAAKKSVVGFLSHQSVCQKSAEEIDDMMIQCSHCFKKFLPVSENMHKKFCKALLGDSAEYFNVPPIQETCEETVFLKSKRKAAAKAEQIINSFLDDTDTNESTKKLTRKWIKNCNFDSNSLIKEQVNKQVSENGVVKCCFEGCDFECTSMEDIFKHYKECSKKIIEGYTCKFCLLTYALEKDIIQHLNSQHNKNDVNFEPESKDVDSDIEKERDEQFHKKRESSLKISMFVKQKKSPFASKSIVYHLAHDFALKFCTDNFSLPNLFPKWRKYFLAELDENLKWNYLPEICYSPYMATLKCKQYVDPITEKHEWKRLKLFESISDKETATIFCGGRINAMAWAPTPYTDKTSLQILAVSACRNQTPYKFNTLYSLPGVIQFWEFNTLSSNGDLSPKFQFGIVHNHDPIRCMEWCPSGCYEEVRCEKTNLRRLGLLAVGCADSKVYLYSVCFPKSSCFKLLRCKPLLILVHTLGNPQKFALQHQVTSISWSKAPGHEVIVVGYASGNVCFYHLNKISPGTTLKIDNALGQKPYQTFQPHRHIVKALNIYPDKDCNRIMTGSWDRTVKYWNLEYTCDKPIMESTKALVNDGAWLSYCFSGLIAYDESCLIDNKIPTMVVFYNGEKSGTMQSASDVCSVSANDWTHSFAQGNAAGELQVLFPHQLDVSEDRQFLNKKSIVSYARAVDMEKSVQERVKADQEYTNWTLNKSGGALNKQPDTYSEAVDQYGMVFCDVEIENQNDFCSIYSGYTNANKPSGFREVMFHRYPIEQINSVALNPNRYSSNFLATGYNMGFLRLNRLKFVENYLK